MSKAKETPAKGAAKKRPLVGQIVARGRAAFPILAIPEEDEIQVRRAGYAAAQELGWSFRAWIATQGLMDETEAVVDDSTVTIRGCLQWILDEIRSEGARKRMYLIHDPRKYVDEPIITRLLRDCVPHLKRVPCMLVLVGPGVVIPPELGKEVVALHLPMPTKDDSLQILKDSIPDKEFTALSDDQKNSIVEAASGLVWHEQECAFALASSEGELTAKTVWSTKAKVISSSELEFVDSKVTLDDVGGMDLAKEYLRNRSKAYGIAAKEYGLPPPLGCVFLGPPGTGKSMLCQAIGNLFDEPLMRFDMSACMRPHVGESERILREFIARVEAMRRVVVWLDEFEKMFAFGTTSGHSDSGLGLRMFSTVLTWMSERRKNKSEVFLAASCNAVKDLSSALTRAGRFDCVFWVGLPTYAERLSITRIHTSKYKPCQVDDDGIAEIAAGSKGYSGAEIEQSIIDAMYVCFAENARPVTASDILICLKRLKPTSELYKEELLEMERWKNRTQPASLPEVAANVGRRATTAAERIDG